MPSLPPCATLKMPILYIKTEDIQARIHVPFARVLSFISNGEELLHTIPESSPIESPKPFSMQKDHGFWPELCLVENNQLFHLLAREVSWNLKSVVDSDGKILLTFISKTNKPAIDLVFEVKLRPEKISGSVSARYFGKTDDPETVQIDVGVMAALKVNNVLRSSLRGEFRDGLIFNFENGDITKSSLKNSLLIRETCDKVLIPTKSEQLLKSEKCSYSISHPNSFHLRVRKFIPVKVEGNDFLDSITIGAGYFKAGDFLSGKSIERTDVRFNLDKEYQKLCDLKIKRMAKVVENGLFH